MGWGDPHQPDLAPITGTTGEVIEARNALRAVGIEGDTLATQAIKAADVLSLIKAMGEVE